ncbi:MAG: phage holin family protein [Flavobacterium sp.]
MEDQSKIEKIYDRVEQYVLTTAELYKLKALQKAAEVVTSVISSILLGIFGLFFLLFISIGLAIYLGEILGNMHYGFFILGGVYLLFAVIVYAIKANVLKDTINTYIVRKIFKD